LLLFQRNFFPLQLRHQTSATKLRIYREPPARTPPPTTTTIRCQAKFLTSEISDFTPCAHAQTNIIHIKYPEKTYV